MGTQFSGDPHLPPANEAERLAIVHGFQAGTLPKPRWTHAAHLVVGSHFVYALPFDHAMTAMRSGVRAYNQAVGTANTDTGGYHETLTRMWLMVLASLRDEQQPASALELAQVAVQRYGQRRNLHTLLYSFDVVRSVEARRTWVPPDLELPDMEPPAGGILNC